MISMRNGEVLWDRTFAITAPAEFYLTYFLSQFIVLFENDLKIARNVAGSLPSQNHTHVHERRQLFRRHADAPHLFQGYALQLRQLLPQLQVAAQVCAFRMSSKQWRRGAWYPGRVAI